MSTKVITKSDLQQILQRIGLNPLMDELIERLTLAFRLFNEDQTIVKKRDGYEYTRPYPGVFEWMPCMQREERVTVKMVAYNPKNPRIEQLPTILSSVSMYDACNGRLLCLVDGTLLTALRTGAASGIASRILAKEDSTSLGMIGCGAQAVTQIHAHCRIFDLKEILVYDTDSQNMNTLNQRLEHLGIEVIPSSLQQVVETVDILCTATSVDINAGPVFKYLNVKPWLHINSIGSDLPGKTELPIDLLKGAFVCPDFLEQAKVEGECQQLEDCDIDESLVEIVKNPEAFRVVRDRLSVFDSTGYALEDQVAMELLHDYAQQLNLGTEITIETNMDDVYDPYAVFREARLQELPEACTIEPEESFRT